MIGNVHLHAEIRSYERLTNGKDTFDGGYWAIDTEIILLVLGLQNDDVILISADSVETVSKICI